VSGRLKSVSSTVHAVYEINEDKKTIKIQCEHPDGKSSELSFSDFITRFRMTIR